jgi:hypothetical protein
MKNKKILLVMLAVALVFGLAGCSAGGAGGGSKNDVSSIDTGEDTFEIGNCILKIPTVDEEFVYLTHILDIIMYFPEIGQNMTVPRDPAVNAYLADNSENNKKALEKAFYERIYKRGDYVSGFNAYKAAFTTFAEKAVPVYAQYERIWGELPLPAPFIMNDGTSYGYEDYWGLHVPEKYIIQLSLYGNNGEYLNSYSDYSGINSDPVLNDLERTRDDMHEIFIAAWGSNDNDAIERAWEDYERAQDAYERARNDPRFGIKDTVFITVSKTGHKGYLTPIELIMHETGHQALNNVDYSTPHERLCELFITRLFGRTLIPNYRVTLEPLNNQIDEIFGKADVLERLPQYLMEFRQKYGLSLYPPEYGH